MVTVSQSVRLWNSIKKMRLLWFNVFLIVASLALAEVGAVNFSANRKAGDQIPKSFKKNLVQLVVVHHNLALKYLLTGTGYANQRVQRPGMAKYLRELSDQHWEDGIETMKKFFKRGGSATDIYSLNPFNLSGKNELDMSIEMTRDMRIPYMKTLTRLHTDSLDYSTRLNNLHKDSTEIKDSEFYDAEWELYFEEKLKDEVKRTREIAGHITSLRKMEMSSLALHIFDSYL